VHVDRDVTDLARQVMLAPQELAIHDDRCTNTRADDDVHHAGRAPARAVIVLAQARCLGIVLEPDRQGQPRFEKPRQRNIVQDGDVRGIEDDAGLVIERAGAAQAHAGERLAGRQARGELGHRFRDAVHHRVCGLRLGHRKSPAGDNAIFRIDQAKRNLGGAQINTDNPGFHVPSPGSVV